MCSHYGEADGRFPLFERNQRVFASWKMTSLFRILSIPISSSKERDAIETFPFRQIWTQLTSLLLGIEVRIEDTYLRDAIHRKLTSPCGLPDGFRRGRIIDAKCLLFVLTDIGMDPGYLVLRIIAHDRAADFCSSLTHRQNQSLWEGSFDDVAWHKRLLSLACSERCTSTLSKKGYSHEAICT